jgi:hypothetical protein
MNLIHNTEAVVNTLDEVFTKAIEDTAFMNDLIANATQACTDYGFTLSQQDLDTLNDVLYKKATFTATGVDGLMYANSVAQFYSGATEVPPKYPPPDPWRA